MKTLITIVVVIMVALFGINQYMTEQLPHSKELYIALDNFTYIDEPKGEQIELRFTSYKKPFWGDCEDFAYTLQLHIGGEVWMVTHTEQINHAVLLLNGYVYDNFYARPIFKHDYPGEFLKIMNFKGRTIDNDSWSTKNVTD